MPRRNLGPNPDCNSVYIYTTIFPLSWTDGRYFIIFRVEHCFRNIGSAVVVLWTTTTTNNNKQQNLFFLVQTYLFSTAIIIEDNFNYHLYNVQLWLWKRIFSEYFLKLRPALFLLLRKFKNSLFLFI